MASFYTNFSAGREEYRQRDWAKRSTDHLLTWLYDTTIGVFVFLTQDIPLSNCDSARIVVETHHGQYFRSKNNRFDSIYRFHGN